MTLPKKIERIHLDIVGGISGDMFVSSLCDAFPEEADLLLKTLIKLDVPADLTVGLSQGSSNGIVGKRFLVSDAQKQQTHIHSHTGVHDHHHHDHRAWKNIREWIQKTSLDPGVKEHCIKMFSLLAEAEGSIHGVDSEEVEFHEVGAWDSIVDFIAAAWFINRLGPASWTWSDLPLGSGVINTQHGLLPVPAPATSLLLKGFTVRVDGVAGERITPTGAAILRHLKNLAALESSQADDEALLATGIGLGSKKFPGVPNILRCLVFEAHSSGRAVMQDQTLLVQFEVDDQSPEDLSCGLDHLRQLQGVYEVFQSVVYGKKNRLVVRVDIIAEPRYKDQICEQCFIETTTIGLRWRIEERQILRRESVEIGGVPIRGKTVDRPNLERTTKVEMDDIKDIHGFSARARARINFERSRTKDPNK